MLKDKAVQISQLKAKLNSIREKQVSEIFFVATQETLASERAAIESLVEHQFASGQNV